jgi:hypothetical protein
VVTATRTTWFKLQAHQQQMQLPQHFHKFQQYLKLLPFNSLKKCIERELSDIVVDIYKFDQ